MTDNKNTRDKIELVEENIIENVLSKVMDPEIEIDIVNLGLIYDIKYNGKNNVAVLMTMSTPACPLSDAIVQSVKGSIKNEYPNFTIDVEITFEPRWHAGLISDAGKEMLGMK
ncbi:MAG TPA: metal-sulfur cluster assembly factor [Flavobacteriaceae bacterium]|nr:metal-sulfur cluster assembly factor [Flavobacteriaceae bacterium]